MDVDKFLEHYPAPWSRDDYGFVFDANGRPVDLKPWPDAFSVQFVNAYAALKIVRDAAAEKLAEADARIQMLVMQVDRLRQDLSIARTQQ